MKIGTILRFKELTTAVGVFVAVLVATAFDRLFGDNWFDIGLFVGCLLAAVATGFMAKKGDGPFFVLVFGLLAVASLVAEVFTQVRQTGWLETGAIDLGVILVLGWAGWWVLIRRRRRAAARLADPAQPPVARAAGARRAYLRVTAGLIMIVGAVVVLCGGVNLFYPAQRHGAIILLGVGVGVVVLAGVGLLVTRPRASTS